MNIKRAIPLGALLLFSFSCTNETEHSQPDRAATTQAIEFIDIRALAVSDAKSFVFTTTTVAPPTTTTTTPPTTTTTVYSPPTTQPITPSVVSESGGDKWERLAECETGQVPADWHINTGNGYYGGLQFSMSSWQAVGGTGYPHEASRATQIEMGERLRAQGGWNHWPGCSRKLGYL